MPKNDEAPHLEVTMRSRPLSVSVSVLSDNTEQLWKSMWGIINNKNTWKGVTMRSRPLSVWKGAAKTPASAAPSIGLYTWMCSWCFCQCWLYSSCAALLLWNPQPFYVKFASQQQQTCVHLEIGGGEILGITSFARLPNQTRVTLDDMKMGFSWFSAKISFTHGRSVGQPYFCGYFEHFLDYISLLGLRDLLYLI